MTRKDTKEHRQRIYEALVKAFDADRPVKVRVTTTAGKSTRTFTGEILDIAVDHVKMRIAYDGSEVKLDLDIVEDVLGWESIV